MYKVRINDLLMLSTENDIIHVLQKTPLRVANIRFLLHPGSFCTLLFKSVQKCLTGTGLEDNALTSLCASLHTWTYKSIWRLVFIWPGQPYSCQQIASRVPCILNFFNFFAALVALLAWQISGGSARIVFLRTYLHYSRPQREEIRQVFVQAFFSDRRFDCQFVQLFFCQAMLRYRRSNLGKIWFTLSCCTSNNGFMFLTDNNRRCFYLCLLELLSLLFLPQTTEKVFIRSHPSFFSPRGYRPFNWRFPTISSFSSERFILFFFIIFKYTFTTSLCLFHKRFSDKPFPFPSSRVNISTDSSWHTFLAYFRCQRLHWSWKHGFCFKSVSGIEL